MKNFPSHLAVAAAALLSPLVGPGAQATALPAPPSIAPAAHETLSFRASARGVQIYECRRTADGAAWAFVAPEAELLDVDGHRIGTHGAGPHWLFTDGRRVTGRVKARADAPQPDAIPWLLLEADAQPSQDRRPAVSSIQRVDTRGGLPPATGCEPALVGTAARVPYSADYLFYGRR